jgi:hypothetical protein
LEKVSTASRNWNTKLFNNYPLEVICKTAPYCKKGEFAAHLASLNSICMRDKLA